MFPYKRNLGYRRPCRFNFSLYRHLNRPTNSRLETIPILFTARRQESLSLFGCLVFRQVFIRGQLDGGPGHNFQPKIKDSVDLLIGQLFKQVDRNSPHEPVLIRGRRPQAIELRIQRLEYRLNSKELSSVTDCRDCFSIGGRCRSVRADPETKID